MVVDLLRGVSAGAERGLVVAFVDVRLEVLIKWQIRHWAYEEDESLVPETHSFNFVAVVDDVCMTIAVPLVSGQLELYANRDTALFKSRACLRSVCLSQCEYYSWRGLGRNSTYTCTVAVDSLVALFLVQSSQYVHSDS